MFDYVILIMLGIFMVVLGADFLVRSGSAIARKMGASDFVIGMTIVALGTSIPELTVALFASAKNSSDIAISNVVGSNIVNILVVVSFSAMIRATPITDKESVDTFGVLMLIGSLVFVISIADGKITRAEGVIILLLFSFIMYKIVRSGSTEGFGETNTWEYFLLPLGILLLYFGGNMTVNNAVNISEEAGISEWIIGATVIAIGTSLPELATSIVATIKKQFNIGVGNIIGSNIFNMLFVLGTTSLISPLSFQNNWFDVIIMLSASFLMIGFMKTDWTISRKEGTFLFGLYIFYLLNLLVFKIG